MDMDVDSVVRRLPPRIQELCNFVVPDPCDFDTEAAWFAAVNAARVKFAAIAEAAGITLTNKDRETADRLIVSLLCD